MWRKGYKAEFSPGLGRSKCKVSPLPCLPWDSVGGLVKGGSAYSTKAELIPLFSGALLGCPLSVYAGTAGSMAGAPGRWFCRGCRLGGALLLSFSGRSSLSLPLSRPSALSPASPGRRWLCCLAGWGIASAGGGWVSLCPHAGLGCCAGFLGCRRWPLSSPCLASSPSPGCCLWALVLLSPSALSPGCWRSSAVLWCWPAMRWGWALALGGVGAGAVQAVAVVAGWWLVCGDLAGLGIVILHKYSLVDLVIFQAKSDKF